MWSPVEMPLTNHLTKRFSQSLSPAAEHLHQHRHHPAYHRNPKIADVFAKAGYVAHLSH